MYKILIINVKLKFSIISIVLFFLFFSLPVFAVPTLTIIAPSNIEGLNTNSTTYVFNVSSNETVNITRTVLEWTNQSGSAVNISANVSGTVVNNITNTTGWTITDLQDGLHQFKAYVYSNITPSEATGSVSAVRNITQDDTNPTVTITSPANATNTTDTTPEIRFNITDAGFASLRYRVYVGDTIDSIGNATNSTIIFVNLSAQGNGTIFVRVEGNDSAGNIVNSTPLKITVDDTIPSAANIVSPLHTANLSDTTPEFTLNATDAVFADDLNFTILRISDGSTLAARLGANNTNVLVNLSALGNGTVQVVLRVRDPAGNERNSSFINITIDDTDPTVTITNPVNATNTTDTTPEITFNITDNVFSGLTYKIFIGNTVDSIGNITNSTLTDVNISAQINGTFLIRVEGTDPAGKRVNSTSLTIYISTTVPSVALNTPPVNATNTTDATPEINFTITDSFFTSGLFYRILANETVNTNGTTSNNTVTRVNLSSLSDGNYLIRVEGENPSGWRTNSTPLTLRIDTTAPSVSVSLSSESISGGSTVVITCSVSDTLDPGTGISSLTVQKPGGSSVSATSGATFGDTSELGTYTISCTGKDNLNNSATTTKQFVTSGGGGSSGGGGGGSGSSGKATYSFTKITPGGTSIIKINDKNVGIKTISISVNNDANDVSIVIQKLAGQPASVTKTITGNVYQYIEITHQNLNDSNVKRALIKFNVTKQWLADNNFLPNEIALSRFTNNDWEKLVTNALRENSQEIEYEAVSTGLSVFAIVGEKAAAPPEATTTTIPSDEVTTSTIIATTIPSAAGQTDFGLIGMAVFVIIVIFVLVYVVYMKIGRKKHHSEHHSSTH